MSLTATITYTAAEMEIDEPPCKYLIALKDKRGKVMRESRGPDREHCLIGLRSAGFTLQE